MAEKAPDTINPEQDIKPLMDEIDRLLAEQGMAPGMPPAPEEVPGMPMTQETVVAEEVVETETDEEAPAEAPAESEDAAMSELAEMLNIEEAQAKALYEASQQLGSLEGKSPKEVGQMMVEDFQLRMQVEKIAGGTEDMEVEASMDAVEEAPAE